MDIELSRDMVLNSKVLKFGDILFYDQAFISRELLNRLRLCGVDTYIPIKKNMGAYEQAASAAKKQSYLRLPGIYPIVCIMWHRS
jgi:hypothetical protein